MQPLVLYYARNCPYSQKVLHFLKKLPINIALKDISQDLNAKNKLLKIGGKIQVPCLVIDGKALYESDEIIKWLTNHLLT